jgi:hypothetical protein|tara:strand:- start:784 stop:1203 length:420 start_codon:yes stop_codon:yes gene_type:complete
MSEDVKAVKIKADVFWCQHDKINEMSGKFQLNLCNLSDAAAAAFEGMGINVQVGDGGKADMGKYITCKSEKPIRVYDTDGDEITDTQIGNGSKAKALVSSYEWTYKNKKGVSPSLRKLIITDLVEYAVGGGSIDDDDVL